MFGGTARKTVRPRRTRVNGRERIPRITMTSALIASGDPVV
jgi:hypothetical protein